MKSKPEPIGRAVKILETNLDRVCQVSEWADLLCYENENKFRRSFLRYFQRKPVKVLNEIRMKSIITDLRKNNSTSDSIAWRHCLSDHNALYSFTKRHTGCSPTRIKEFNNKELSGIIKKSLSEIVE
ncbi:MAG: AraC family transcriptional regulator [Balneolales bacterium]